MNKSCQSCHGCLKPLSTTPKSITVISCTDYCPIGSLRLLNSIQSRKPLFIRYSQNLSKSIKFSKSVCNLI